MLVAVVLLALCACLVGGLAMRQRSWIDAAVAVVAALACVGTIMLRPWSRLLVYLLNIVFAAVWGYSLYVSYHSGLLRYLAGAKLARFLIPDAAMVLLISYCSYAVTINLRHRR